jgi:hypothetical protein
MATGPLKDLLETALKDFRQALVEQKVYAEDHENLRRACNGARDFVDFLLEGSEVLRKGRRRPK